MPKGETSRPMNKDERSAPKGKSGFNTGVTREDVRISQKWAQDLSANLGGTINNMMGSFHQKEIRTQNQVDIENAFGRHRSASESGPRGVSIQVTPGEWKTKKGC